MGCPIVFRGAERRGRARRRPAQPGYASWYAHVSGPEGGRSRMVGGRCQGAAEIGHPRSEPGDLPGKRNSLRQELRRARTIPIWTLPIGKAKVEREGQGRDHRRVLDHGRRRDGGGRKAGRKGHFSRSHQPAHHPADGYRDHRALGEEDQPPRQRRGRLAVCGIGSEIAAWPWSICSTTWTRRFFASPARTFRCPMRPTSKSWRCRGPGRDRRRKSVCYPPDRSGAAETCRSIS
jgi:hypothetical protein